MSTGDLGTHMYVTEKHNNAPAGAGNGETLRTLNNFEGYGIVYYDPVASRTGVILEAGVENGQHVTVVNKATGAFSITFATAATSNVAGGANVVIGQNQAMDFKWSVVLSRWIPVIGVLSGQVGTANIAANAITSALLDPGVRQRITVSLTATQIKAMSVTPVTLIAAPGIGKTVIVEDILFTMVTTATVFANGGIVTIQYASGNVVHTDSIPATVINAVAGTSYTVLTGQSGTGGLTALSNTAITITNATAPFITGTGTATVDIVYRVV